MTPARLLPAALFLLSAGSVGHGSNPFLGRRIYEEGILSSGAPLRGVMAGDLIAEGTEASCSNCHRHSGMGSAEGGTLVPPITRQALFQHSERKRADLFGHLFQEGQPIQLRAHLWNLPARPAYTTADLARALRQGIDTAGHALNPAMPRYHLSDEDVGNLAAYLTSLSAAPAPGVDPFAIHFATVIQQGIDPGQRKAMLDVMRAYLQRKNQETEFALQPRQASARALADPRATFRRWILDVWEVRGPAETWPAQLLGYYRKQPVFALIGGMASGPWQPIASFCEQNRIPCLFPETIQPDLSVPGHFTVYFTRGVAGEAAALAAYLRMPRVGAPRKIVQVYRASQPGIAVAEVFRAGFRDGSSQLQDRCLPVDQSLSPGFWKSLLRYDRPDVMLLWLDTADLSSLQDVEAFPPQGLDIYLSYTLAGGSGPLRFTGPRLFFIYPFALPGAGAPEATHARAWLLSTGVADPLRQRTQFDIYFALSLVDYSMNCMGDNFSREYLLETVERETETAPNPGVFPRLSLGPEQRFASKGARIVTPSHEAGAGIQAFSAWIVP